MNYRYIISSDFDYKQLISRDHGPAYAEDMGWSSFGFKKLSQNLGGVIIVDNRLSAEECEAVVKIVRANPGTLFVFTMVDPYYEWEKGKPYINTLFTLKDENNVCFLSKYAPRELAKDLDDASGNQKMVVIPYPYRDGLERPINFSARCHRLVVSGNMHAAVYPLRVAVRKHVKWNPLLWRKTRCLDHPGYPDIGHQRKHAIIGDSYIQFLSGFTLMLLCPSRCELEFLKYTECAFAGCVPVGQAPASFDESLQNCVLKLDRDDLSASLRALFKVPIQELECRALEFRRRLSAVRSPRVLNLKLEQFLAKNSTRFPVPNGR